MMVFTEESLREIRQHREAKSALWSLEHQAYMVQTASDLKKARYHLRELRKRVDNLERRTLARLKEGGSGGD